MELWRKHRHAAVAIRPASADAVTIASRPREVLVARRPKHYVFGMTQAKLPVDGVRPTRRSVLLSRRRLLGSTLALPFGASAVSALAASPVLDAGLRDRIAALPLIRGDAFGPEDLSDRIVVASFFASWCPPCRPEMAHLNQIVSETDPAQLLVVGLNLFEHFGGRTGDEALHRFLDETGPQFPIVRGDRSVADAFGGVDRIPTLYVFDPSGRLSTHFVHRRGSAKTHLELDELRAAIAPMISA